MPTNNSNQEALNPQTSIEEDKILREDVEESKADEESTNATILAEISRLEERIKEMSLSLADNQKQLEEVRSSLGLKTAGDAPALEQKQIKIEEEKEKLAALKEDFYPGYNLDSLKKQYPLGSLKMEEEKSENSVENNTEREDEKNAVIEDAPKEEDLTEKRFESIMKQKITVPTGEHWIVREMLKCDVHIEPGAKLTALDIAIKNNIRIEENGTFDSLGKNIKNEINQGEQVEVDPTAEPIENTNPEIKKDVEQPFDFRNFDFSNDKADFGEKVCPNCGTITGRLSNFCGKCAKMFEDSGSIGPLTSDISTDQGNFLYEIHRVKNNKNIDESESRKKLNEIFERYEHVLSSAEQLETMDKYEKYFSEKSGQSKSENSAENNTEREDEKNAVIEDAPKEEIAVDLESVDFINLRSYLATEEKDLMDEYLKAKQEILSETGERGVPRIEIVKRMINGLNSEQMKRLNSRLLESQKDLPEEEAPKAEFNALPQKEEVLQTPKEENPVINNQIEETPESIMGWVLIKKIKKGDIEGAKQMIENEIVNLDEEQKDTLGWIKVRAQKENNSDIVNLIDEIIN